jgi:hypothetical protein
MCNIFKLPLVLPDILTEQRIMLHHQGFKSTIYRFNVSTTASIGHLGTVHPLLAISACLFPAGLRVIEKSRLLKGSIKTRAEKNFPEKFPELELLRWS